MDPDQTAPIGAVCSGFMLFASILNSSVILGNYLQQTTFSDAFFLGVLRVKLMGGKLITILCPILCLSGWTFDFQINVGSDREWYSDSYEERGIRKSGCI